MLGGGGKSGSNSTAKSLFDGTDASPAQATSGTDNNATDTTKTNVTMPQAKSANLGDNGTPIEKAQYDNKIFQSMQNITNYERGYSGGAGRGLPPGVNTPQVTSADVTSKSEVLGKQINTIDKKQESLDSQAANGLISNSEYEQRSAALAAQRSDLASQQNTAQIAEMDALSNDLNPANPAAGADAARATAEAEAKAWDTPSPTIYDPESGLTYANPDYYTSNNDPYSRAATPAYDWGDPATNPYSAQNTPDTAEYEPYTSDYSSASEYTPSDDYNVE